MIKKFTEKEYESKRSSDYLTFECEMCGLDFKKQKKFLLSKIKLTYPGAIKFCSKKCEIEKRTIFIEMNCSNCNNIILTKPHLIKKSKSGNMFCNKSCAASFNNRNKTNGTRRSKIEVWIENELKKEYGFEIIFNGKEAINSELDIYIPSLGLAFELNGIFHYEPIYGKDKLESIKNNDDRKFQACLERNIELCIIDTTSSKNFKPERDKKYLDIINNVIKYKIG